MGHMGNRMSDGRRGDGWGQSDPNWDKKDWRDDRNWDKQDWRDDQSWGKSDWKSNSWNTDSWGNTGATGHTVLADTERAASSFELAFRARRNEFRARRKRVSSSTKRVSSSTKRAYWGPSFGHHANLVWDPVASPAHLAACTPWPWQGRVRESLARGKEIRGKAGGERLVQAPGLIRYP